MAKIDTVVACFTDKKDEKEIYYSVESLKEAAWLYLKDHPRGGEHKILVEEKTEFHPLGYTYKTSDLRDYKPENRAKPGKSWYFSKEDEKVEGPIFKEELIEKIQNKSIPKGALVWEKGINDWQQINKVADFEKYFDKDTPPPLPQRNKKNVNKAKLEPPQKNKSKATGEEQKKSETVDTKSVDEKRELTNRWLKFYLYLKIPTIIFSLFSATLFWLISSQSSEVKIVFLFVMLPLIIIYSILWAGLYRRKRWGYNLNWAFILLEPVLGGVGAATVPGEAVIFIGVGLLIYTLPNYIYFTKRKHLFG